MQVYTVCIGQFKEPADSTKTLKQLNERGYKGYLFAMDGYYTLKVVMNPVREKAETACSNLRAMGFPAFIV